MKKSLFTSTKEKFLKDFAKKAPAIPNMPHLQQFMTTIDIVTTIAEYGDLDSADPFKIEFDNLNDDDKALLKNIQNQLYAAIDHLLDRPFAGKISNLMIFAKKVGLTVPDYAEHIYKTAIRDGANKAAKIYYIQPEKKKYYMVIEIHIANSTDKRKMLFCSKINSKSGDFRFYQIVDQAMNPFSTALPLITQDFGSPLLLNTIRQFDKFIEKYGTLKKFIDIYRPLESKVFDTPLTHLQTAKKDIFVAICDSSKEHIKKYYESLPTDQQKAISKEITTVTTDIENIKNSPLSATPALFLDLRIPKSIIPTKNADVADNDEKPNNMMLPTFMKSILKDSETELTAWLKNYREYAIQAVFLIILNFMSKHFSSDAALFNKSPIEGLKEAIIKNKDLAGFNKIEKDLAGLIKDYLHYLWLLFTSHDAFEKSGFVGFNQLGEAPKLQISPMGDVTILYSWSDFVPDFARDYLPAIKVAPDLGLRTPIVQGTVSALLPSNPLAHNKNIQLARAPTFNPSEIVDINKYESIFAEIKKNPKSGDDLIAGINFLAKSQLNNQQRQQKIRSNQTSLKSTYLLQKSLSKSKSRARHFFRMHNQNSRLNTHISNENITLGHTVSKAMIRHAILTKNQIFDNLKTKSENKQILNALAKSNREENEWHDILTKDPEQVSNSFVQICTENLRRYGVRSGESFALQKSQWLRGKFMQYMEETCEINGIQHNTYVPAAYTSKMSYFSKQEGTIGFIILRTPPIKFIHPKDQIYNGHQYLILESIYDPEPKNRLWSFLARLSKIINQNLSFGWEKDKNKIQEFDGFSSFIEKFSEITTIFEKTLSNDEAKSWKKIYQFFKSAKKTMKQSIADPDIASEEDTSLESIGFNWPLSKRNRSQANAFYNFYLKEGQILSSFFTRLKGMVIDQSLLDLITLNLFGIVTTAATSLVKSVIEVYNTNQRQNIFFYPRKDGNQISYGLVPQSSGNLTRFAKELLSSALLKGNFVSALIDWGQGKITKDITANEVEFFLGRDVNAAPNIADYDPFVSSAQKAEIIIGRLEMIETYSDPRRLHNEKALKKLFWTLIEHIMKANAFRKGYLQFFSKNHLLSQLSESTIKDFNSTLNRSLPYLINNPRTAELRQRYPNYRAWKKECLSMFSSSLSKADQAIIKISGATNFPIISITSDESIQISLESVVSQLKAVKIAYPNRGAIFTSIDSILNNIENFEKEYPKSTSKTTIKATQPTSATKPTQTAKSTKPQQPKKTKNFSAAESDPQIGTLINSLEAQKKKNPDNDFDILIQALQKDPSDSGFNSAVGNSLYVIREEKEFLPLYQKFKPYLSEFMQFDSEPTRKIKKKLEELGKPYSD
jgi:hypothetical protein